MDITDVDFEELEARITAATKDGDDKRLSDWINSAATKEIRDARKSILFATLYGMKGKSIWPRKDLNEKE